MTKEIERYRVLESLFLASLDDGPLIPTIILCPTGQFNFKISLYCVKNEKS